MKTNCLYVLTATAVLLCTGCFPTVTIQTEQNLCAKPVTLHLIGLTEAEYQGYWENLSMTNYWKTNPSQEIKDRQQSLINRNLFFEHKMGNEGAVCAFSLEQQHPVLSYIVQELKNHRIKYILVLVDMPEHSEDRPGNTDARRYCFNPQDPQWLVPGPLFSKKAPKRITIHIENNNIYPIAEY